MKVTLRYARYLVTTLTTIGFFLLPVPGERQQ